MLKVTQLIGRTRTQIQDSSLKRLACKRPASIALRAVMKDGLEISPCRLHLSS